MDEILESAVARATERLDHARSRLRLLSPAAQVEQGFLRLDDLANRLGAAAGARIDSARRKLGDTRTAFLLLSPEARVQLESHKLLALWKRLQAASPASVLNRGFAIVRDEEGRAVTRRAKVKPGQRLTTEFADGEVRVRAEES
jgi:exodeoxyribonuclease VII large subunit